MIRVTSINIRPVAKKKKKIHFVGRELSDEIVEETYRTIHAVAR